MTYARLADSAVLEAANTCLAELEQPVSTRELVRLVLAKLELHEAQARDVSKILMRATATHPAAVHDGETFIQFGRQQRRWRWKPLAAGIAALFD